MILTGSCKLYKYLAFNKKEKQNKRTLRKGNKRSLMTGLGRSQVLGWINPNTTGIMVQNWAENGCVKWCEEQQNSTTPGKDSNDSNSNKKYTM